MSQVTKEKQESLLSPATEQPDPQPKGSFARLPFSALEKVAFGASIVGTLAGIGGTVTLSLIGSANTTAVIIATVCWVACLLLLASRFRWAPVATTAISGYILYILFTQPFATASLADPRNTQVGGIGHFIGSVLLLACALLEFGASLSSAVQNYRKGASRQAPRWLPAGLALVVGLVIGATFIGIMAQPPAPTTSFIDGVPAVHMSAANFDQPSVTIPKGSKLVLVDDTSVLHILYNGSWNGTTVNRQREQGAPTVNGLQVNGNSVVIGPFTEAGTFHIYCAVHPGMNLTIVVR